MNANNAHPSFLSTWCVWPAWLASSWTWCIGLYLPVLLSDRYGWPGVLVFTAPNLLGVALFGFGIRSVAESRSLSMMLRPWMVGFSLVTIAFHIYVLSWLWPAELGLSRSLACVIAIGVTALAWGGSLLPDHWLRRLGPAIWMISLLLLGRGLFSAPDAFRAPIWESGTTSHVIFLAPILLVGFLLCPYLDLTFHRAYRSVGGDQNGRRVFLNFSIMFAVMIALTTTYAIRGITWPAAIHIVLQMWFTMTLHMREIRARMRKTHELSLGTTLLIAAIVALSAMIPAMDYRHWFVFYGLIFPALVWLIAGRRRLDHAPLSAPTIFAVILLCIPFAVLGFIGGQEWLLVIPPALLLLLSVWGPSLTEQRAGRERIETEVDVNEPANRPATMPTVETTSRGQASSTNVNAV